MDDKIYRCGYCGTPTYKDGHPMSVEDCQKLTEEQLSNAEQLHGWCCIEEEHENYIIVTHDMAIDAGDLRLEGERWKW